MFDVDAPHLVSRNRAQRTFAPDGHVPLAERRLRAIYQLIAEALRPIEDPADVRRRDLIFRVVTDDRVCSIFHRWDIRNLWNSVRRVCLFHTWHSPSLKRFRHFVVLTVPASHYRDDSPKKICAFSAKLFIERISHICSISFKLNCDFPLILEFSEFLDIFIACAKLACVYPASAIRPTSLFLCNSPHLPTVSFLGRLDSIIRLLPCQPIFGTKSKYFYILCCSFGLFVVYYYRQTYTTRKELYR